ncbi:hypothetical protein CAPTEDRAFT_141249 [Capitella teleta]|uniref:DOMON domain-containing protein n=1 Tax=Capitella teleta TaxID=283909 RepID=R7URA5_CAPTE|nr:hypothetical protein CAPTEDRAFT_141249 [Capitella teleta]|eukprot:ELU08648.1 hypothetical protein CAPTEDRAFT_141249 [Capitella teleta]
MSRGKPCAFLLWVISNALVAPLIESRSAQSVLKLKRNRDNVEKLFNNLKDPVTKFENEILLNRRAQLEQLRYSLQDERAKRIQIDEDEEDDNAEYRYQVVLDTDGRFQLLWDIESAEEIIYFRLVAQVEKADLLAFGFSGYGEATNADLVVLWTDHRGHHRFQDTHTDQNGLLSVDSHQDYTLDNVKVKKGEIIVDFHRLYDTCDDEDYMIDSGTTHVIFFTKEGPTKTLKGLDISAVTLGLQRAQLIKSQLPDPVFPDDTFKFTMNVENVEIPNVETTYWCHIRKLPEMREKHHIIKYEGTISEAAVGVVHHMEVFHCEVPADVEIRDFDEPCSTMETRPEGLESCRRVIGAWAMGAQAIAFPEEAGLPIGGPDYSRYIMMEVHYNNPELKQGIIDSSGLTFYVTKQLRPHDSGIMELGLEYTDKMALPPGVPIWRLNGYCVPECTAVGLGKDGIKVFASQLHTHLTGKSVYTKHYRNGVELPELNRDNHYSPHYQEIRKLKRQVTVLPGDSLVTTCEDTTIDKTNVTFGGFSISDEMCLNYIHYYPHVELEVCKSSVPYSNLYDFFAFLEQYQGEPTSAKMGVSDNYNAVNWTPVNVELLRAFYDTSPISMQCNQSDGNRFPGEWEGIPVPEVSMSMPPTERPCLT